MEHITLDAKDIKALTGAKDEVRALWKLQMQAMREASKPFVRKVRVTFRSKTGRAGRTLTTFTTHRGQTKARVRRNYIGDPQVYYKEIREDPRSGLPLLRIYPANNGFHWFDLGTDERHTDSRRVLSSTVQVGRRRRRVEVRSGRGGYRGYIKPLHIFKNSYQATASEIQGTLEESMAKVMDKAIGRALKKANR